MKLTITHEEIKKAFSEVYNSFYLNHRLIEERKRTDEEWEQLITDANTIRNKYNSVFVSDMLSAILKEFENEDKGINRDKKVVSNGQATVLCTIRKR